jgi:UDP-N-acetylglucosamine--N-acetylmuramyl-(pentapeptide) pyrophosphoryl-undecaprenol N-acetylglucosamine transferase
LRDYERVGQTQHKVTEFIDDMAAAYAWADVVVCRSGALTVSEIAAAGLPAIFVPFQHKDRQQYWNARPLEEAGAAKIIEQPQFNADTVADLLASWDRPQLLAMAEKARAVAIPDATERVAAELVRVAK